MKRFALLIIASVLLGGCLSRPARIVTPAQLVAKRDELLVLDSEIDQLVRALENLQRNLAQSGRYAQGDEERDLEHAVTLLRKARDRLSAQQKYLRTKYNITHG